MDQLGNIPKVTELVSGGAQRQTGHLAPVCALQLCFTTSQNKYQYGH